MHNTPVPEPRYLGPCRGFRIRWSPSNPSEVRKMGLDLLPSSSRTGLPFRTGMGVGIWIHQVALQSYFGYVPPSLLYSPRGEMANSQIVFHRTDEMGGAAKIAIVGVGLSHLTHFLSVLALYGLTKKAFGTEKVSEKAFCFISALLHIITPAGAFLSAPYGEPVFSLLNFAGFYIYASALHSDRLGKSAVRDAQLLLAASSFAIATTVRSNGIISGALFAYDCVVLFFQIASGGVSVEAVHRLIITILGGIIVALGMILPQYVAYTSYCTTKALPRPWCQRLIPSIYTWVQAEYW